MENVRLLEKEKIDVLEIVEAPNVLKCPVRELKKSIAYLKREDLPVSIGHLKCVPFRKRAWSLQEYHKLTDGI